MISLAALFIASARHVAAQSSDALDLLHKMHQAVRAASPIKATLRDSRGDVRLEISALYPGLVRMDMYVDKDFVDTTYLNKGGCFAVSDSGKVCIKSARPEPLPLELGMFGLEAAFSDDTYYGDDLKEHSAAFNNKSCLAVDFTAPKAVGGSGYTIYIDPKTYLPVGFDEPGRGITIHNIYTKFVAHAPLTEKDFAYHPGPNTMVIKGD